MAEAARKMEAVHQGQKGKDGKYLTFTLGQEEYGIGILKVREIIGILEITTVPRTPEHIKGVINLRGKVIPVISLRSKFGIAEEEYTDRTCIIVVEILGSGGSIPIGIIVDSVSEVLNISGEDIEPTPNLGSALNTDYLLGLAKVKGRVQILLDIDRVLASDEESVFV
jgi:purine-binding chemotaxis protein CheW